MSNPIQKNQTVRRDYMITVTDAKGKTQATVKVRAEGVRDALKQAHAKVTGWQGVPAEDLDK